MARWVWFILGAAWMAALDYGDIHLCAGQCDTFVGAPIIQERLYDQVPAH